MKTLLATAFVTALASTASAQNQTVVTPQPASPPQPAPTVVQPQAPTVVQAPPAQSQGGTTVVEAPPAQTTQAVVRDERNYERVPNRSLLISGVSLFAATYLPSVVVASSSTNDSDRALLAPIVGPFIDMGARRDCAGVSSCEAGEAGIRFLLAADGVLQTVGAFMFASAFIWPTKVAHDDYAKNTTKKFVRFTPMQFGKASAGAGLVGSF